MPPLVCYGVSLEHNTTTSYEVKDGRCGFCRCIPTPLCLRTPCLAKDSIYLESICRSWIMET